VSTPTSATNPNSNNSDGVGDDQLPARQLKEQQQQEDFDAFTAAKAADLAKPLKEANIPYKIHIVKDHDMRERLCLEVERLGLCAVIMGSRGAGAERRGSDGKLGSVSDYCVHHCVCPVVVVRNPDEKDPNSAPVVTVKKEGILEGEDADDRKDA
jgi:nucleotide-binding universal stress UspA family protein